MGGLRLGCGGVGVLVAQLCGVSELRTPKIRFSEKSFLVEWVGGIGPKSEYGSRFFEILSEVDCRKFYERNFFSLAVPVF